MYLGRNVNDYAKKSKAIILQAISEGKILCELCLKQMRRHSEYTREIKETKQEIVITVVWCRKCVKWHALLPDFLLPNKHYSADEIESVIIDSATEPVSLIDTEASESTVRRWMKQIGDSIVAAIGKLKVRFGQGGQAVSEIAIYAGHCYSELAEILEMAPAESEVNSCGNRLGLANIWLRTTVPPGYI